MTETVIPEGEGWSVAGKPEPKADSLETTALEDTEPAERWRRFTPPALVEDSLTDVIVEGGEMTRAADVTWPKEVIEKIRQGYQCLKCWEPQPEPFPTECGNPFCSYAMRRDQAADFEKEFHGDKWVGPTVSLEEQIEILAERSERKVHKPGSSIIVPGWARL